MGQALTASCLGTLGRKDEKQSPWHTLGTPHKKKTKQKQKSEILVKLHPKFSHEKKKIENRDGTVDLF